MIERWAQHGFVVGTDQDGEAFTLPDGRAARVETERAATMDSSWPEYFHILTNIEQNGEFLPKAKELARWFFARANYDADDNYQPFDYSPDALDQRMKAFTTPISRRWMSRAAWIAATRLAGRSRREGDGR